MSYLPLNIGAGVYRAGTEYESKGRWYDCNLIRFDEQGRVRPMGGWRTKSTSTVTGVGRAIISWTDNSGAIWTAIATQSHLYAMSRSGVLTDITPSGFTSGRADAVAQAGYGAGNYGAGTYGTPRPDSTAIQDVTVGSMDNFGQNLVFCNADDGYMYEWALNTSLDAVVITNAPTARALFVTNEGMLCAIGAASNPRNIAWSDQRDDTVWTADATNQAGDFDLTTAGRGMQGKRIRGGHLIWTDLDLHLMTYTADTLVYSFAKVGDGCGAISQNCAAVINALSVWMGRSGFWTYNGFVQPLPCDVADYVFSDLNQVQRSKVTCCVDSAFSEVTWHYPSSASNENDRYVKWNYRSNVWDIGELSRLSGADRAGATLYPLKVSTDGYVYEHEVGFMYDALTPYIESGPFEIGNGDNVAYALKLIPDEKTQGDVTATFKTRFYPNETETTYGPYSLASSPVDVRFCGRQGKVRYTGAALADWRVGNPRLEIRAGGRR